MEPTLDNPDFDVDLADWEFGLGEPTDDFARPYFAESIRNSLKDSPPDLLFGGNLPNGELLGTVLLSCFAEGVSWEYNLSAAILWFCDNTYAEDIRPVVAELRRLADQIERRVSAR